MNIHQSGALQIGGLCLEQPRKWETIVWERILPFLVLVNVTLNPFPHTTSIREITFYSAAALLAFYFIRYRDWRAARSPFTLPAALLAGWSCLGLFWALDFGASLHDIRAHLLRYIVLFLLLIIFFNSSAKRRLLFWAIIVSVVVSGFHDMYFFYGVENNHYLERMTIPYHQLPVGPLGFMAVFASLLAVHLLRTGKNFWERCALTFSLIGLLLIFFVTQMRALLLAMPFVIGAIFWDKKKILSILLVFLIIFSILFFTKIRAKEKAGVYLDRLTWNYMSLLMIKARPLTGIGYGMNTPANHDLIDHEALRQKVPEKILHKTAEYNNPHNSWMSVAVRLGLPGLFLFAWLFVAGARLCFAAIRQAESRNLRLQGQLCLSVIALFAVYGLVNEIFMHLLEMLLCVSFALAASLPGPTAASPERADVDQGLPLK